MTENVSAADAISEAISSYVEACIVDAVRSLPPSPIPSPVQARLRVMVKQRRRTTRVRRQVSSDRETFHSELFHLRSQLDGQLESGTTSSHWRHPSDFVGSDNPSIELTVKDALDGHLTREEDATIHRPYSTPSFLPYSGIFKSSMKGPVIHAALEPAVDHLVIGDPVFEQVVKTVETDLRTFAKQKNLALQFNFLLGKDPEYPNWKRYVVSIESELDFDEKMDLWTEIDTYVRQDLRRLSDAHPQFSEQIGKISSNLFLHMEL